MAVRYRDDVWYGLLDADRVARYYAAVAAGLRRRRRGLDGFTALGSTSAVGSMLLDAPHWTLAMFMVCAAVASVWSLVSHYADDGARVAQVADEMRRIASRWQLLWSEVDTLNDDEVKARMVELLNAMERCTDGIPQDLAGRRRLNERCAAETYAVMEAAVLPRRHEERAQPARPANPPPLPPPPPPPTPEPASQTATLGEVAQPVPSIIALARPRSSMDRTTAS